MDPVKNSMIIATRRRENAKERQKYVSRSVGMISRKLHFYVPTEEKLAQANL